MDTAATGRLVTVVLNPASGRGDGARQRPHLETLLNQAVAANSDCPTWRIVETTRAGDAMQLASNAASQGANVVAAAGGDGTLGEVVNGIHGTGARLGIIPMGTGNDFARHLGIAGDLEKSVHTLFHGRPRPVDVGIANGRRFINVAGCGLDAVVAARVNRGYRWLHGTPAYIVAVVESLLTFRPALFRIRVDGRAEWETRAMLCSVANSSSFGGGMMVAPDAQIDDGLLDVCVLAEAGRIEFLRAFPRVFKGSHVTHPKVTMLRAKHIYVESDPPMPILIDGDVIGRTPVEFTIEPRAIEVMAPAV